MGKSRSRRQQTPEYSYQNLSPSSPQLSSAFEDFFDVDVPTSRPVSAAFSTASPRSGAMGTRPPTLTEILLDVASPPWTLSAFMAYLSQNHCMESLEFTLDSQRYTSFYNELIVDAPRFRDGDDRVCSLWEKLMQVYIIPCAPREVNIPAHVRDRLLSLHCGPTPPPPSSLDEAGKIIFELMNDSLLVPFIQSVTPLQLDMPSHEGAHIASQGRIASTSRSGSSANANELDCLTDDSDCNSPQSVEPMTPPTTPPTSDWAFNPSPGGLQRAVAAHNKGWKKVGARLGFNRKSSSRRSTPSSTTSSAEVDMHHPDSL